MKLICVEDEPLILQMTVSLCQELSAVDEAIGFQSPNAAVTWLRENTADIALLDIDMPEMNGITLASHLKQLHPDLAIIFLTGYSEYAVDAFALHASGYLLKPINRERLSDEINYALYGQKPRQNLHIAARTFGNFELLVDGQSVIFGRSKAKELLAYLIDRQGRNVSRAEAFSILWENGDYDRSKQKQLDVIVRSLRDTLRRYGISEIFEMKSGSLRVCPDRFDCDLYRFLSGDAQAVNAYRGEYMNAYPWANLTEAYVTQSQKQKK